MAVNQSQVDHIITAASEDDPEVKLQNLEREVDLIKTSIKRLLMDIRERMNELENPFTLVASGTGGGRSSGVDSEVVDAKKSALEARTAALDARESQMDASKSKRDEENYRADSGTKPVYPPAPTATVDNDRRLLDEQLLAVLKNQIIPRSHIDQPAMTALQATALVTAPAFAPAFTPAVVPAAPPANEKLRLQKVYKLFKWTTQSVRKFGHDRLEIMLGSYQAMGYISKDSCDEIREISRLMPANLGEEHEVGPDEFVSELYALNRILVPNDTSLDRDMIEVMMEQRQQEPVPKEKFSDERLEISSIPVRERTSSSKSKGNDEDWMNLPDRI
jgi:hypothetical protein